MKWNVEVVDRADDFGRFSGSGCKVINKVGHPLFTIGYLSHAAAEEAKKCIKKALANALSVDRA